jgi:hypothetical protein
VDAVLGAAEQATGLSDFGDPGFREGLRVLLETYEKTADFNEKGRKRNWRRLVQLLSTRLRVEAAFTRHPEIREREIRSPVYLTGLPRTGTSALFNLLGADRAARPLLLWEGGARRTRTSPRCTSPRPTRPRNACCCRRTLSATCRWGSR